jgi:hypothetical protein
MSRSYTSSPPKRLHMDVGLLYLSRWYMSMVSRSGMIWTGENRRTRRKTGLCTTLSTTNPIWTDQDAKPDLCGERPATNRLNYSTAWRTAKRINRQMCLQEAKNTDKPTTEDGYMSSCINDQHTFALMRLLLTVNNVNTLHCHHVTSAYGCINSSSMLSSNIARNTCCSNEVSNPCHICSCYIKACVSCSIDK